MTEWGSLSLVDQGEGDRNGQSISLPGVKKGDMSSRHWKPEVRVVSIQFSPTGDVHSLHVEIFLCLYAVCVMVKALFPVHVQYVYLFVFISNKPIIFFSI